MHKVTLQERGKCSKKGAYLPIERVICPPVNYAIRYEPPAISERHLLAFPLLLQHTAQLRFFFIRGVSTTMDEIPGESRRFVPLTELD